jgi:hypothetical protein
MIWLMERTPARRKPAGDHANTLTSPLNPYERNRTPGGVPTLQGVHPVSGVYPSSLTGKARNPLRSGKLLGVRQMVAPSEMHDLLTASRDEIEVHCLAGRRGLGRSRVSSTVCAGLPLFSKFSKSCIFTICVTSGCRTLTMTLVSPFPMSPPQS